MDSCFSVAAVVIICLTILAIVVAILLALPKSRLGYFLFEFFGWGATGVSTALFVSPVDLLPFVPLEDPLYVVTAIAGAVTAYFSNKGRKELGA